MRRRRLFSLVLGLVFALMCTASAAVSGFAASSQFASGTGTKNNPWHIRTAAQLNNVRKHLDGNFVLDKDIDLKNYKNFQPIGTFQPAAKDEEQANPKAAFTGTFDGNNHTIKNLTIKKGGDVKGVGLFGASAGNAKIRDLNVRDANVTGGFGTGAIVGYASENSVLDGLKLVGKNTVSASTMVGGITGAANNKLVRNCTAVADVYLTGDNSIFSQCAGVLMGGDEGANMENCHALGGTVTSTGKVVNGNGINGLGGLAGCVMSTEHMLRCTAKNITIRSGEKAMLIGGLAGFSGNGDVKGKPTLIKDCIVDNVKIIVPESAERIGGIVGGGFYVAQYKQYYQEPIALRVENCYATCSVTGGKIVGSVAGYIGSGSSVTRSLGAVTHNGRLLTNTVGGTTKTIPIEQIG